MDDKHVRILVEFFMDSFREDPAGVGDWFAQGGNDVDTFYDAVVAYRERRQKEQQK